jgi:hypothetical protein
MICRPGRTAVSYEPSYSHFDSNANHANPATNMGRKIFGTFVPDIDVRIIVTEPSAKTLGSH